MWNVGPSINHLIVGQLGLKVNVSAIDSGTPPTKIVVYGQTVLQKSSVLVITILSLYDGVSKLTLSLQTAVGSNVTTNTVVPKHVASWQQWLDRSVLTDKTGTTFSSLWASDSLRVGITTGLSFE